ncbi:MAG: hypothetical protein UY73_C0049G0007 [Parcubacteria group bacterium GW2011_GWA2_52_8]|nr:MAG: hypothetical protein UY73_C0049G0007 [Parcubacteria group bacterium GW2011_GWA2_52_8]
MNSNLHCSSLPFKTMQQVFVDACCLLHGVTLDPKWVNEK